MEDGKIPARTFSQNIGLVLGPVMFFLTWALLCDLEPHNHLSGATGFVAAPVLGSEPTVPRMAALAVLMAVWWITEAVPLFATALLPMVLFPLLGIKKGSATAPLYVNSTIFLFVGGFMIALTMSKWGLHKRIALWIIRLIRGGPSMIVLGFMAASAFLSMWISNTATAIVMFPIGLAIITRMEENFGQKETHVFSLCLLLGIAYACSVGGMGTLVGTPPNLAFREIFHETFPKAPVISFGQWMLMGLPFSAVLLASIWLLLTKVIYRIPSHLKVDRSIVNDEYRKLGSMSFEEKIVLAVFTLTAFLWVFRKNLTLGTMTIPGWSQLLPYPKLIDDGTIALLMAMIMFLIPSRGEAKGMIMSADVIKKVPWNIVLLFGGGFALARGFTDTGLSSVLGAKLQMLSALPPVLMIALVCLSLTFLTELTSNTATTQTILPILASVGVAIKMNPLMLMIPATLSASCAFMMPVATPPNAIVFGSGRIKVSEMAWAGIFINIVGVVVVTALFYLLAMPLLGIDPNTLPEWAKVLGKH